MDGRPDYSENLLVHFRRVEELKKEAVKHPSHNLSTRQLCDLELLLNRGFFPLVGYMNQTDYESVLDNMRLANNAVWPIPICLDIKEELAQSLTQGQPLVLRDGEGFLLAVLEVENIWKPDKRREALAVFGTDNPERHPGVRNLFENTEEWYVGGKLEGIHLPIHYDFKELRLTPSDTHRRFAENGWKNVIGFHTEKPLHCAHREMTLRAAREVGASIFIQPTVDLDHPGDVNYYTQVWCYLEIIKKYPRNMISLGLIPLATRKAGPREALWQAVVRKNYGCTHFMVENDHGDPLDGSDSEERFYKRHLAQELVQEYETETGVTMVSLRKMVYVEDKGEYISHDEIEPGMRVKEISSNESMKKKRTRYTNHFLKNYLFDVKHARPNIDFDSKTNSTPWMRQ